MLLSAAYLALVNAGNAIGDMLAPDEGPAEAPPSHVEAKRSREAGDHRHKFDANGFCTTCGKAKSANGRKPAGAPALEAPPADTRTTPLPIPPLPAARPLGDAAADRFADGGQGSSMVRR